MATYRISSFASLLLIFVIMTLFTTDLAAQNNQVIRIAKIKIDSIHLEAYKAAVKEQVETAMRVEPGVLMQYAVSDKNDPTNVTVFEIYANTEAYQAHLQTSHFKKYKSGTASMVKSLQLIDVDPIMLGKK